MSVALLAVLFWGIFTQWSPARWPLAMVDAAIFGLALVAIVQRRASVSIHPLGLALALAAVCGLAQIVAGTTIYQYVTFEAILIWTANTAAFSIALASLADARTRARFLLIVEIFAVVLAAISTLAVFTSPTQILWTFDVTQKFTPAGPFPYKNQYAAFAETAMAIALTGAIRDRRRSSAHLCGAGVIAVSVIASGSRAGAILLLCVMAGVPILARARGWISTRVLIRSAAIGAGAIALVLAVAGWEAIWARFQEPNPYALRANLVYSSLEMITERPMMGFGLGTWSAAYPGFARFDDGNFVNQAHNDWVQWAAEGGLPFFILMLVIFIFAARMGARVPWGIGLVAVFVHALVDYPFQQRPALAAFFFALLGALAAEFTSLSKPHSPGKSYSDAERS